MTYEPPEAKNVALDPSSRAEQGASDVLFVLGTRPEIIKLAPIIRILGDRARIVHTGQHYDPELSDQIWTAMGLPEPQAVFAVGGKSRAEQLGDAVVELDEIIAANPPAAVVVQGDTNATLAGALAASFRNIPLVHVEAGLRSFDRAMPEEHNRVIVDHISDLLCAPTETNAQNLRAEGLPDDRIHVTGNSVVEAVQRQLPPASEQAQILADFDVRDGGYVLATIHRPENTDDPDALATILGELARVSLPVIFPLHPRTRHQITARRLDHLLEPLRVIEPVPPREFLGLAAGAAALVSDSGGLQEECSVLKRPLLVVRNSTERPEVMGTFARRVLPGRAISEVVNQWIADVPATREDLSDIPSPYGDGCASVTIAHLIERIARSQAAGAAHPASEPGSSENLRHETLARA